MTISKTIFVCLFLIFGFAFFITTVLLLEQKPDDLFGTDSHETWKAIASMLLSPIKVVLMGPLIPLNNFLHQDPDTPPPFFLLGFIFYWTLLALTIYYFFNKRKSKTE